MAHTQSKVAVQRLRTSFAILARDLGLHVATLARWRDKGILGPEGARIRLKAIRLGGRWTTTAEDVQDFLDKLNATRESDAGTAMRSLAARSKSAAAAERQLDALGI